MLDKNFKTMSKIIKIHKNVYITKYHNIASTYIFECSSLKNGVERVNQEKRLVELAGYITLAATNSEECDVDWRNQYFVFLHVSPHYF